MFGNKDLSADMEILFKSDGNLSEIKKKLFELAEIHSKMISDLQAVLPDNN